MIDRARGNNFCSLFENTKLRFSKAKMFAVYCKRVDYLNARFECIEVCYTEASAQAFIEADRTKWDRIFPSVPRSKDEYMIHKVSVEEAEELISWIAFRERH